MERVAAIDIGSNAIRYSVAQMNDESGYTILERNRFALRLGRDSFMYGNFSEYSMGKAEEHFIKVREELDRQNVDYIRAVATSAFREAANSEELCRRIFDKMGIVIHVIDGLHEAKLILQGVRGQVDLRDGEFLLVDVGGGSVELTAISRGHIIESQSFDLGTVRILNLMERGEEEWSDYFVSVKEKMAGFVSNCFSKRFKDKKIRMVATGGNARRLGKLRKRYLGGDSSTFISRSQMEEIHNEMKSLTPAGRVRKYDLKFDRAEVIVPAAEIFLEVSNLIDSEDILLPKAGLIHGIFEDILRDEL